MAENIYNRLDISDEKRVTSEEEIYKQIKLEELSVVERERKSLICESCVSKRLYGWYESVAVFFCFACEIYVCVNCLPKHESHKGMKVWRKESERENGRETSESDRMSEQGLSGRTKNKGKGLEAEIEREEGEKSESERLEEECDGKISLLLDDLINESETERIEKFENSHVSIIDRVHVKHELDQRDCFISGMCGLENKRLVVCDCWNDCIKIFKLGSHVLQRYIRIVGSGLFGPWDVTEIDLKQNSTEPNLVSGSSSDISATGRADPDKQCLIAVTLPWKRQIMFIDLSKNPAKAQKTIKTEKECYSIQFYDDKIFTVCREGRLDSPCSVYIYSTDGDTVNKFDTGIYGYVGPHLAIVSGRVYITDWLNDKVEYRNVEGQLISEITIKGSGPAGISVDPDNNVYVCARGHNKVYKLDADLTRYKSVLDQTTDYIEKLEALCYYRDKLFIGHYGPPSLRNFVTVVRGCDCCNGTSTWTLYIIVDFSHRTFKFAPHCIPLLPWLPPFQPIYD